MLLTQMRIRRALQLGMTISACHFKVLSSVGI